MRRDRGGLIQLHTVAGCAQDRLGRNSSRTLMAVGSMLTEHEKYT